MSLEESLFFMSPEKPTHSAAYDMMPEQHAKFTCNLPSHLISIPTCHTPHQPEAYFSPCVKGMPNSHQKKWSNCEKCMWLLRSTVTARKRQPEHPTWLAASRKGTVSLEQMKPADCKMNRRVTCRRYKEEQGHSRARRQARRTQNTRRASVFSVAPIHMNGHTIWSGIFLFVSALLGLFFCLL